MTISLNVLEHLGINLYSNVQAVLSELVANSWDANATEVEIIAQRSDVSRADDYLKIKDNGLGMTRQDVATKFLSVGYKRRPDDGSEALTPPPLSRHVMGRKGIGKLSSFSIAKTVTVRTVKDGQKTAFRLDSDEIRDAVKTGRDYLPTELPTDDISFSNGTEIILTSLNSRITRATIGGLKSKIARRFSIIGPEWKFKVSLNGEPVKPEDRGLYSKLEFIWYFGDESRRYADMSSVVDEIDKNKAPNEIDLGDLGKHKVRGWIGTVKTPKDAEEDAKKIVLMAHGKIIKEDLLIDIKDARIFSSYLLGEIEADFLDLDDKPDIVTSDRQRISEDDPRYQALMDFIVNLIKEIGRDWTELRNKKGVQEARKIIAIADWIDGMQGDTKKMAEKLIGKLYQLPLEEEQRRELYRSAVIGFEAHAHKDNLSQLDSVQPNDLIPLLLNAFKTHDDLEEVFYWKISQGRVHIIKKFVELYPTKREHVIRDFLKDHLWLINPAWERATDLEVTKERSFKTIFKEELKRQNLGDIPTHRVDIYFRIDSIGHAIIELKKSGVNPNVYDLSKQGNKYMEIFNTIMDKMNRPVPKLEVLFLLGEHPVGHKSPERFLSQDSMAYKLYDQMLEDARADYEKYLESSDRANKILGLVQRI